MGLLKKILGKSPKTTLTAIAAAALIAGGDAIDKKLKDPNSPMDIGPKQIITAALIGALGRFAKDDVNEDR
jgi:hypothetical protein